MKRLAKVIGIVVVVLVLVLVALPFLINPNQFRPLLESQLSSALGRDVKVGDLKLALLSGSVTADDLSISDDPAFGQAPFVRAKSLSVGVDLMPLILSRKVNVTGLTIDQPEISLLRSGAGDWNFSKIGPTSGKATGTTPASAPAGVPSADKSKLDLSVSLVKITGGRLSIGNTKGHIKPLLLENVDIEVRDFSPSSVMPFSLSAKLSGDGEVKIDGKAGPINSDNAVLTPVQVSLKISHLDLAATSVLESSPTIDGLIALDGTATSDGKTLDVSGQLKAEKLKLVKDATPATSPVELDVTVSHDLSTGSGAVKRGNIHVGSAVASLVGTYSLQGETVYLKGTLSGPSMPLQQLEGMLPALHVALPAGSSIQGGTAAVKLGIEGPVNQLVATGSLGMNNARLGGFDLGTKMSVIEKLAGIKGGPNTDIETLSTNLRASQQGGVALQDMKLVVPAVGELSGAGTVSPANELDFKMSAMVHASGVLAVVSHTAIPFSIQGTASNPVFKADVKGLAAEEVKGIKSDAVKTGLGLLNGFIKKK